MAQTVKNGDKIRVHYTGTLNNGEMFDSSIKNNRPPLEFTVGAGQMIKGFDKGVVGMAVGETRMLKLPPEEAAALISARVEERNRGTVIKD